MEVHYRRALRELGDREGQGFGCVCGALENMEVGLRDWLEGPWGGKLCWVAGGGGCCNFASESV